MGRTRKTPSLALRRYVRAILRAGGVSVDGLGWQGALDALAALSLYRKGDIPPFGSWAAARLPETEEDAARRDAAALAELQQIMR